MSVDEPVTVLIVDDHAVVRQGVRTFLETQGGIEVVGEAESGPAALRLAAERAPDLALVDLVMPGMDGVEVTRGLLEVSPRTRVMVLTSYHDDERILPAIRAGALSYVLKDVTPPELVRAVRRTAKGEGVLDPRVATLVLRSLRAGERASANLPGTSLSEREREVLELLAEGLGNAAIADRLAISHKTVKSHVSNILGKLHLADRTQAAVYAWREGMVAERGRGVGRSP